MASDLQDAEDIMRTMRWIIETARHYLSENMPGTATRFLDHQVGLLDERQSLKDAPARP